MLPTLQWGTLQNDQHKRTLQAEYPKLTHCRQTKRACPTPRPARLLNMDSRGCLHLHPLKLRPLPYRGLALLCCLTPQCALLALMGYLLMGQCRLQYCTSFYVSYLLKFALFLHFHEFVEGLYFDCSLSVCE